VKSQAADTLEQDSVKSVPVDIQIDVLFEMMHKVMEPGTIEARIVKYKLQKNMKSRNIFERVYALDMIITDGKGLNIVPDESNIQNVLECITAIWERPWPKIMLKTGLKKKLKNTYWKSRINILMN
jgi:ATP-dependent Lon protease